MGIQPDVSPYGGQTVTGPGWPNVDENALAAAAAQYEALAAKIGGTVVPQQQSQLMNLTDTWEGGGSMAAAGEATTIIGGHEANAAQAAAIAAKLRTMEAAVIQTKTMANIVAQETQAECMAIQSMPVSNTQALVQSRIMLGLSQNSATVTANASTMANSIGAPASTPTTGTPPVGPQQVAGQDPSQAMQMMGQLAGLVGQIPQMLGQAMGQVTQAPQQLAQTVGQPLQQLTSMFGQGGGGAGLGAVSPFSAFSNHPLAGGGGAGAGAGMVRAAGLPGGGGGPAQSPLMASLVGSTVPVSVAPAPGAGAGSGAIGGMAPVAAGGGMGGGMGPMMGQRGTSGGTTTGLALPEALEYDLAEDDVDEDW